MSVAVNKFKRPTYYVVGGDTRVSAMMGIYGYDRVDSIHQALVVVFSGGPDINPLLYGQAPNKTVSMSLARDRLDLAAIRETNDDQILVGICRGGQLLNVVCGYGSLYQNVNNHALSMMKNSYHAAHVLDKDVTKKDILVTSTHHQMMIPGHSANILMTAREATLLYGQSAEAPLVRRNLTDLFDGDKNVDVEACHYWSANNNGVLCYQPHPEYMSDPTNDDNTRTFFELLEGFCVPSGYMQQIVEAREERLTSFQKKRAEMIESLAATNEGNACSHMGHC